MHLLKDFKWVKVAEKIEAENLWFQQSEAVSIKIEQQRICIVKYQDKYYALQNNCPHANASLADGWCDNHGNIVCPVHRIKFNLATGKNATGEGYYINTFPIELNQEGLFVGIKNKKWWSIF